MIIGLTGLIGSGKSEVARILTDEFAFTRVKFADPLKNMIRTLLADIGHIPEDIERYIEGDLKESVIDGLEAVSATPRGLMQTLGTEWGRNAVDPDLWITLWRAKADRFERVVADDVRFKNEVEIVRRADGEIWEIARPGVEKGGHVSEQLNVTPDRIIINNGTLDDLAAKVRALCA